MGVAFRVQEEAAVVTADLEITAPERSRFDAGERGDSPTADGGETVAAGDGDVVTSRCHVGFVGAEIGGGGGGFRLLHLCLSGVFQPLCLSLSRKGKNRALPEESSASSSGFLLKLGACVSVFL